MKTFADSQGRTWTLALTLGVAKQIKSKLDIDLLQPEMGEPPLLTRLGTDEILLGEVLLAMMESQFERYNLTEQQVQDAFDGPTLLKAQTAFYDELIDFFRSRGRTDRAKAVAAQKTLIDKAITAIEMQVDAIDVDKLIDGALSGN
jgi:hypothetical protein